jgi:hypothetical protein
MKYLLVTLASVATVSAHGYVSWGVFGDKNETFFQPYQDAYMNPKPKRISRPVQGNGPVQDVTISDVQCGGYAAGGFPGSEPAALHVEVAAGTTVELGWTLWPESHMGVREPAYGFRTLLTLLACRHLHGTVPFYRVQQLHA